MSAALTCDSFLVLLQMEELKIDVLPQVEGSSMIYEGPYDVLSILAWLHATGQAYYVDCMGRRIAFPQLVEDARENCENLMAAFNQGERHTAPAIPAVQRRSPLARPDPCDCAVMRPRSGSRTCIGLLACVSFSVGCRSDMSAA